MAKPPSLPVLANTLNELLTESGGRDLSLRIKGDTATLVVKDVDSGTVKLKNCINMESNNGQDSILKKLQVQKELVL